MTVAFEGRSGYFAFCYCIDDIAWLGLLKAYRWPGGFAPIYFWSEFRLEAAFREGVGQGLMDIVVNLAGFHLKK